MSLYLNCSNLSFKKVVNSGFVDKSDLLSFLNAKLNTENGFICVSRPRRFGKSVNAKMINAYYSKGCNSKELFDSLDISKDNEYSKHLNKYNVIYLDMQSFKADLASGKSYLDDINQSVIPELKAQFSECFDSDNTSSSLPEIILDIYKKTHEQFIFIIDEWDYVFRTFPNESKLLEDYIEFLRQIFKAEPNSQAVMLAYITGILPIKKYKTESALNNFKEYTMLNPGVLAQYFGFTKEEVKKICTLHDIDFEETCRWYDGYKLKNYEVFNPVAIMGLCEDGDFQSYWAETGSFEGVKDYIKLNFEGLRTDIISLINGNYIANINTNKFKNDLTSIKSKDAVIVFLIHLGYLAYDSLRKVVYIPNEEVRQALITAVEECHWTEYSEQFSSSTELLNKTVFDKDCAFVSDAIEKIHQELTSIIKYSDENGLSIVVNNAYSAASEFYYKPKRELPSGKGFADLVFIPKIEYRSEYPALVIELKWNKSAQTAIEQIKEKHYCDSIKEYTGNILLVGINYDKDSKKHTCLIEEYSK